MSRATDAVKAVALLAEENDKLERGLNLVQDSLDMKCSHYDELRGHIDGMKARIDTLKNQRRELVDEVGAWREYSQVLQLEIGELSKHTESETMKSEILETMVRARKKLSEPCNDNLFSCHLEDMED